MQLFANGTKHKQYIYQIEAREMLIKIPRSKLKTYLCLAKKWSESQRFMVEPR